MAYVRKTVDEYRLLVNYGEGWEHEVTEFSWTDLRRRLKEYRAECRYPLKTVKVRVKIENGASETPLGGKS